MRKTYFLAIFILTHFTGAYGQQVLSFKDTIAGYNNIRISKNVTGDLVRGIWGIGNLAAGGVGVFIAKQDEWKYFHGMNAGWGLLNVVVASSGLHRAHRQLHESLTYEQAAKRYRADKRHYLIGACVDVACIATGTVMTLTSKNSYDHAELFSGFGKSIAVQGVFLLILDNVMYAAHMRDNSKWFRIMDEIRMTGNGIGFNYTF